MAQKSLQLMFNKNVTKCVTKMLKSPEANSAYNRRANTKIMQINPNMKK